MGYWNQNEAGESFAEGSDMIWGDSPADAMGDAVDSIIDAFARDMGRPPTKREIRAGLEFTLRPMTLDEG